MVRAEPREDMKHPLSRPEIWWHWEVKNFRRVWIPVVAKTWFEAREKLRVMQVANPEPKLKSEYR